MTSGCAATSSPPSSSEVPPSSRPVARRRRRSAANAVIDSVQSIIRPTPAGDCVSLAVVSHGEYGTPEGLVFGFPVRSDGATWSVEEGLSHSDFARERIKATTDELLSERQAVEALLG